MTPIEVTMQTSRPKYCVNKSMFTILFTRNIIFITISLCVVSRVIAIASEPTKEYEIARNRLYRDINEFWRAIRTNLETLGKDDNPEKVKLYDKILMDGMERHGALMTTLEELQEFDGYKSWRKKESTELGDLVQSRIHFLQNPERCSKAPKLFCKFNKLCGLGCQFGHMISCLILAYGTNRTLVFDGIDWSYNGYKEHTFGDVFQELSKTCLIEDIHPTTLQNIKQWPGTTEDEIVECPRTIESEKQIAMFTALPEDLADRIIRISADPIIWWRAQFVKFVWNPRGATRLMLDSTEKGIDQSTALVGLHIRRTDKIVEEEGSFHDIEEYMKHAEEYFQRMEMMYGYKINLKQIYVASDDPSVLSECKKKFPGYIFYGDEIRSRSADLSSRYSFESLQHIITDIHMLSKSDFLVCTLSSNVCQLAYEIQQQRFVDGSMKIQSLDVNWNSAGFFRLHEVVYPHTANAENELDIQFRDIIRGNTNLWNGYSSGVVVKGNRKKGLYPSYKTREVFRTSKLPTYQNAKYFSSANISRFAKNEKKFTQGVGNNPILLLLIVNKQEN